MTNFTGGHPAAHPHPPACDLYRAMLLMLCLTTGGPTVAAESATATIDIKLTVLAPVCKVTAEDGGELNVDFGENINGNDVDPRKYYRLLNYKIDCGNAGVKGKSLKLEIKGENASFTSNLAMLKTTTENLGIIIYRGGMPFQLNQPLTISDSDNTIGVALIKNPSTALKPGPFTATATLLANYE